MPSYIPPRKFFTRSEILLAIRDKNMRRRELEVFFYKTIGRLLPRKKIQTNSTGYSKKTISLAKPKLSKQQFNRLLGRLKMDNLIEIPNGENNDQLRITAKGISWLNKIITQPHLAAPQYAGEVEKSERVTIISYDIPERLRLYRDWLRIALRGMGFDKIQQSVWVGKIKLPSEFVADLTRYQLEKYVEIFEITKAGTLLHKF